MRLICGHSSACASAIINKNGLFYVVTVGHFCDGHIGEKVEFLVRGVDDEPDQTFELGTIRDAAHDATYDVGVIEAPGDRVARNTLGLSRLGDPYPFVRLQELDDLRCHFYLGAFEWRRGFVDSVEFDYSHRHALSVLDQTSDGKDPANVGHSGSPLYVRGPDGYELIAIYIGRVPGGPLKFMHPGPGLGRLGFRLS
jgi:hypothetical protein